MGRTRIFLKLFDFDGTYQDDFVEVTKDVQSKGIGAIKLDLDNNEFDIGLIRISNIKLKLFNGDGNYSDVGDPSSIFIFTRRNTQVKVTWEPGSEDLICGFFNAGRATVLTEPITIFEGILKDDAIKKDADSQFIEFLVFGKQSIFDETETPFSAINNGDLFSEVIFKLLTQLKITSLLTVNALNLTVGNDVTIDDKLELENTTVLEALKLILLYSNSVLFVRDNTIFTKDRDAIQATPQFTFNGAGALDGIENITDMKGITNGVHRTINVWRWDDTNLVKSNGDSVIKFGFKAKDISTPLITDTAKIESILQNNLDEFQNPMDELMIETPMTPDSVALNLLYRVNIDYPNVPVIIDGEDLSLYGSAVYAQSLYAAGIFDIEFFPDDHWKILNLKLDTTKQTVQARLRRI